MSQLLNWSVTLAVGERFNACDFGVKAPQSPSEAMRHTVVTSVKDLAGAAKITGSLHVLQMEPGLWTETTDALFRLNWPCFVL